MDPQKIAEYRQTFQMFDRDGSGEISATELVDCLKTLGQNVSKEEAIQMIRDVDVNKNGVIDFTEFLTMMATKFSNDDLEKEIDLAFENVFDKDGDGFLSVDELKFVMSSLGDDLTDKELEEMIIEADKDGDGKVSHAEFRQILLKK